jgi:hypothetical protein
MGQGRSSHFDDTWDADVCDDERETMKGSQKPKKLQKKRPQTTLKQRRVKKREVAKQRRSDSGSV